jgi:integral membrane sensor domain MASE1
VLLGFILLGAGFRIAGGVFRGALAGAGLYVLIGIAFSVFLAVRSQPLFQIAFERSPRIVVNILVDGEQWPVICLLSLFGYR